MILWEKKLSDLICSCYEVNSATVPVSFLIQGLFLLSDQMWKNSSIKIWFFPLSWEVPFWEMVYLYCDSRRHLSPSGDKAKLPRDQRRLHKICCSWEKPEEDWTWVKTRDSSAKVGTELIKNPFEWSGWCSYCDFCVWDFTESGDILVGSGF